MECFYNKYSNNQVMLNMFFLLNIHFMRVFNFAHADVPVIYSSKTEIDTASVPKFICTKTIRWFFCVCTTLNLEVYLEPIRTIGHFTTSWSALKKGTLSRKCCIYHMYSSKYVFSQTFNSLLCTQVNDEYIRPVCFSFMGSWRSLSL